ncbi:hypothetical protein Dimus_017553 [Dionaea muscipula]
MIKLEVHSIVYDVRVAEGQVITICNTCSDCQHDYKVPEPDMNTDNSLSNEGMSQVSGSGNSLIESRVQESSNVQQDPEDEQSPLEDEEPDMGGKISDMMKCIGTSDDFERDHIDYNPSTELNNLQLEAATPYPFIGEHLPASGRNIGIGVDFHHMGNEETRGLQAPLLLESANCLEEGSSHLEPGGLKELGRIIDKDNERQTSGLDLGDSETLIGPKLHTVKGTFFGPVFNLSGISLEVALNHYPMPIATDKIQTPDEESTLSELDSISPLTKKDDRLAEGNNPPSRKRDPCCTGGIFDNLTICYIGGYLLQSLSSPSFLRLDHWCALYSGDLVGFDDGVFAAASVYLSRRAESFESLVLCSWPSSVVNSSLWCMIDISGHMGFSSTWGGMGFNLSETIV